MIVKIVGLLWQGFEVPECRYHGPAGGYRGLHGDSVRGQSALHHPRQESDVDAQRHDPGQENQRRTRLLVVSSLWLCSVEIFIFKQELLM